jgi:hypothetical protein
MQANAEIPGAMSPRPDRRESPVPNLFHPSSKEFRIMIRHDKIRAALVAGALVLASSAAFGQSTFIFPSASSSVIGTALDNGPNAVTVGLTGTTTTATFSDPNSSGDFVFTPYGGVGGLNAPVILSDTGGNGTSTADVLDVSFSQAIGSLQFVFGLGNAVGDGGDTLNVALFDNGVQVGSENVVGSVANDTGLFTLNGTQVTSLVITATSTAANAAAANYASVNIEPAPEPTTWALMGVGLLAAAGVARRRQRQAAAA